MGKYKKRRYHKRSPQKFRLIVIFAICLFLFLTLAGVRLNNVKNDFRMEAITYYNQGDYEAALECFDAGLAKWAPFGHAIDTDIMLYQGSCYLLQGDASSAAVIYDMLSEHRDIGDDITKYRQICAGLTSYASGNYEEAIQTLISYAADGCYELYLYIGSAYLELGDGQSMLEAFDSYESYGQENSFLHAEMAAYDMEAGDYENAMAEIEEGLLTGTGYERELRWLEVCCLECMLDFNSAYEKMNVFQADYTLSDSEKKEWDFLQSRYTND